VNYRPAKARRGVRVVQLAELSGGGEVITGFLTGSRVYGQPKDDSDLDLCLLVTHDQLNLLRLCSDLSGSSQVKEEAEQEAKENAERNYPPNGRVLRFGKLNVICFVHNDTEGDFHSFALGTQKMLKSSARGKDNRGLAVTTFQSLMNTTADETASAEVLA
jgi:predicted nucleotidyltransferase